ncbi:BUD13-like protein [Armadillidium nasatum]|uniref:BUD13 homolog n=1 Tax=Armadillidium nasatum TaxID=96803 RepID=A0A5N5SVN8_9CRUS|nr:BUD13-like protein [Armadillidium nasatum]
MSVGVVNQQEYLKKYLDKKKHTKSKEKKKKKISSSSSSKFQGFNVIDESLDLKDIPFGFVEDDCAPTVAEVTYESEKAKQIDEFKSNKKKWKGLNSNEVTEDQIEIDRGFISIENKGRINDDYSSFSKSDSKVDSLKSEPYIRQSKIETSEPPKYDLRISQAPHKTLSTQPKTHNSDTSPPEQNRDDSDTSPPRRKRHDSNTSSPRRKRHDSDTSPRRKRHDSDTSPPQGKRHDSDTSPPHLKRHDSDTSPPRRKRHDSDTSPPRRKRHDSDTSPPRRKRRDSDTSPPRRKRHDSDTSPPRRKRHDSDTSPPRRKRRDSDTSPPRRKRHDSDTSPPRRKRHDSDTSPPRRKKLLIHHDEKDTILMLHLRSAVIDSSLERSHDFESTSRRLEKYDTDTSQIQNERFKKRNHANEFENDSSLSSFSKRKGNEHLKATSFKKIKGKIRKELTEEEKVLAQKLEEKYQKWNKGIVQDQKRKEAINYTVKEMGKSFARAADDEDMNRTLKGVMRQEDPMLEYMTKKNIKENPQPLKPRYKGSFPPNRFNIAPGYRWDGVDRSSGYEKEWFTKQSSKRAIEDESYKWSTEDM